MKSNIFSFLLLGLWSITALGSTSSYEGRNAHWEATVQTNVSWFDGKEYSVFELTYHENHSSGLKLCGNTVNVVFVIGEGNEARSYTHPMHVSCGRGDSAVAKFRIGSASESVIWNQIFPPTSDGNRRYAIQVAAQIGSGWDSDWGRNYPIILEKTK